MKKSLKVNGLIRDCTACEEYKDCIYTQQFAVCVLAIFSVTLCDSTFHTTHNMLCILLLYQ